MSQVNQSIEKMQNALNPPIALLKGCLQNGRLKELRMLFMLKFYWNGSLPANIDSTNILNRLLGYKDCKSTRVILKNLNSLGWINYDKKSNLIFVKGFDALRQQLGFRTRGSVYLYVDDLKSNCRFKGFVAGAIINDLINSRKRRLRKLGPKKGGSIEDFLNIKSGYCQIANSLLMSVFNCSIGQAYNLKRLANNLNYVKVKKTFINTGFHISDIQAFKRGYPELTPRLARINNKLVLTDCDLIRGNMKLSRRGKI